MLETLEGSAQVPQDTRGISTALHLRREEFDAILKNLDKMNRPTKRTHLIDRTERFIMAQGWTKKMEAIFNDLVNLQTGIDTLVSSWDVAKLVRKVEEIVTIDLTKQKDSRRWRQQAESNVIRSETVNVDQILMTMVKLNDAHKMALNQYGNLNELALPDALYEASQHVLLTDPGSYIPPLQRSAELLHPDANFLLGLNYQLEKDLELAAHHFRVASSRGDIDSTLELMNHYDLENDRESVLKYIKTTCGMGMTLTDWIRYVQYSIAYGFESSQLVQPLIEVNQSDCALQQSVCYFFGIGVRKSNQKAVDVLRTYGSGSCSAEFKFDCLLDNFIIVDVDVLVGSLHCGNRRYSIAIRNFTDFLWKENQILHFLLVLYATKIYSTQKWKRYARRTAASNCIDAHILLAEYYSWRGTRDERGLERHIRIAADAPRTEAQSICRRLYGHRANVSKGLGLVDEGQRYGNQEKGRHQERTKQSRGGKENHAKRELHESRAREVSQLNKLTTFQMKIRSLLLASNLSRRTIRIVLAYVLSWHIGNATHCTSEISKQKIDCSVHLQIHKFTMICR